MKEGGAALFRVTSDELNINFATCFSYAHLMDAAIQCEKGVRWKRQVQAFMADRVVHCAELYDELHGGTYRMRQADFFHIIERGKPRDVKSINIRDRVVQRCLADNVMIPLVNANITAENSACIKGRGLDYAFNRVKHHMEEVPPDGYILQFDFHDYFHSIDKDYLMSLLNSMVLDDRLLALFAEIVYSEPRGLELGSHISQLCAVIYPQGMDQAFIGEGFGYHRYMDDGIVFCADRAALLRARNLLMEWIGILGLTINERKLIISRATQPVIFCKLRLRKRPWGVSANVTKRASRKSVRHLRKVRAMGVPNLESVEASILGYLNRGDADLTRLVS